MNRKVGNQLLDPAELEFGPGPAQDAAGLVVEAGAAGTRLELGQAPLGLVEGVERRAREEAVEEEELGDEVGLDPPAVGPEKGLVGRAAPQGGDKLGVLGPAPGCGRARETASRRRGSSSSRPGRRGSRRAP